MKGKYFLALLLALSLALSVTPAFAQGFGNSGQFCAGGNTTINSGQTVNGLALFGCSGTVQNGGTVAGDAVVFGGSLNLQTGSNVNRNIAVFGGSVEIAGTVGGDVAIAGGSVHLSPSAVVNGTVRVAGGSVSQDPGSTVRGGISRENNASGFPRVFPPFVGVNGYNGFFNPIESLGVGLVQGLITALALAALGALLVVFFPQPTRRVMETAQHSIGPSLGVGCLTLLVAPVLFLLLLITIVGPVLLVLALAAAWIFGWIAVGYLAGERIVEAAKMREIAPMLAVVLGVLVLAIVGQVPCLGWLISLLIGTAGIGAVLLTRFGTRPYPYTPAWATAGPMGPLPPGPVTPASGTVQPASPSPAPALPEANPNPGTETPGGGGPQV
jgi:hypothetical protein